MKRQLLKWTLCAGLTAASTLSLIAGPLRRADVAANPTWVAHIDFDGLRTTALGQYIQSEMEKPEAQAKLAAFQAVFSMDLRTQLHAVTLYSTGTTPQEGVLLVYADFEPERLVTLAKAAKDSQNTSYGPYTIYNWLDEKLHKRRAGLESNPRVYAAIAGSRVVFSQRDATLKQALDVLTGATPSLAAGTTFPQLGAAGDTSFIEAAARKMNLPENDPNAALLRLSKAVWIQISGAHQELSAALTLEANDADVASHMLSVGQGLTALMKLQTGKPEAATFANALSLRQDGSQVIVNLSLPDSQAVSLLKANAARKHQAKAEKAEGN